MILVSPDTLQRAGIPLCILWTGSHRPSVVNLRTALCFALYFELQQPQLYIASLLEIAQSTVSDHIKRHFQRYNHDPDYTDTYDSVIKALKKARLIKEKSSDKE